MTEASSVPSWIASAGILHAVDADELHLILLAGLLDDGRGGQRHVVVVEETALDVRVALQQVLPEGGDLGAIPVAGRLVDDRDARVVLQHVG